MNKFILILLLIFPSLSFAGFQSVVEVSCEYSVEAPIYVPQKFELGYYSKGFSEKVIAIRYKKVSGKYKMETVGSERIHSIAIINYTGIEEAPVYTTIFDLDSLGQLLSGNYFAMVAAGSFSNLDGNYGTYHATCFEQKK